MIMCSLHSFKLYDAIYKINVLISTYNLNKLVIYVNTGIEKILHLFLYSLFYRLDLLLPNENYTVFNK